MKKIDSACCKQGLLEIKDACAGAVKEAYGSDRLLILDEPCAPDSSENPVCMGFAEMEV